MRIFAPAVILAGLAAISVPGATAGETCDLEPSREGRVERVIDGQTLMLEGGETVRLIGALAPETPGWWKGPAAWPVAARAKSALERLVTGRSVRVAVQGRQRDRHKRLLAHLFVVDGPETIWVQGRLVEEGHARAYSLEGSRACVRALQRREARARAARAGLWGHSWYAIVGAGDTTRLSRRRYAFQIVEGRIVSVARTRAWTFLNFSADYKTDFTVAIRNADRKHFRGSDVPLDALTGKRVRVRGWIERWNGPMIKAAHPEQIELPVVAGERSDGEQPQKNPAPGKAPGSVTL